MGNSKIELSYFNGLGQNLAHQKSCLNYLKTKQNTVTITGKHWHSKRIESFFKLIDQWNIKRTLQEVPAFPISSLVEIGFPYLMNLSLQNNLIETIEPLSRIWLPSLQVLDLSNNKIRNVKALRRINFKKLKRIYIRKSLPSIDTNYLLQTDCLSEINLGIQQIGISEQISINWSLKTFIKFSDFGKKDDLLKVYNIVGNGGKRTILMFQLMINSGNPL